MRPANKVFPTGRDGARKGSGARLVPLEKHLERTATDFLEIDGWRSFKMEQNFSEKKFKVVGEEGMADRLYLRYKTLCKDHTQEQALRLICGPQYTECLWIEWKRVGGKASTKQTEWHELERARGALTWIAGEDFPATYDGFRDFYLKSGLARRVRP